MKYFLLEFLLAFDSNDLTLIFCKTIKLQYAVYKYMYIFNVINHELIHKIKICLIQFE